MSYIQNHTRQGFTLIELSIVLVIIGLIIGSILAGKDMIEAAAIRGQLAQIEKYNTSLYVFRDRYNGYLPGDIPEPDATAAGFVTRGTIGSTLVGNGNGLIEGRGSATPVFSSGFQGIGEVLMFWRDLSDAKLIQNNFSTAVPTLGYDSRTDIENFLPKAKIGGGNYIYVYTGGAEHITFLADQKNYYGISVVSQLWINSIMNSTEGLSVSQAYSFDVKIDDGLPMTGNVTPKFPISNSRVVNGYQAPYWAGTTTQAVIAGAPAGTLVAMINYITAATPASATTCFDNNNTLNGTVKYSMSVDSGSGINCAISVQIP
jgi:prepilin-type N-terminal cleavage/methylation domain-containing protein